MKIKGSCCHVDKNCKALTSLERHHMMLKNKEGHVQMENLIKTLQKGQVDCVSRTLCLNEVLLQA